MDEFTLYSPSQQLAGYLRSQLIKGRWSDTMPGSPTLARELGIDSKTIWAALGLLEEEGILVGQGTGRPRKIILPPVADNESTLRIAILDYEAGSKNAGFRVDLHYQLTELGHQVLQPSETLTGLGMTVAPVRKLVGRTTADAWIVCGGSREILEWFAGQPFPTLALFGRRRDLPIAGVGPDHEAVRTSVAQRLVTLGHKRIVVLARESQRVGGPGRPNQAIFHEMAQSGIATGTYNFPDWEDSAEGLIRLLDNLFRLTPPTALIIDDSCVFHAVKNHLARKGLLAPDDLSLVCTDPDPSFAWLRPTVTHFRWDSRPVVRRVIDWADKIGQGIEDTQQTLTKAELIEGGTIGPPPQR